MCDPMTIAGIALSGVSAAANGARQSAIQDARDDAMAAERIRQKGFWGEQLKLNDESRAEFEDFEDKRQLETQSLQSLFETNADTGAQPALMPDSSEIVNVNTAKQSARAKQHTDRQAKTLAALRSFGNVLGDANIERAKDAQEIGMIGGLSRGSQSVLPMELEAANSAGAGAGLIADIAGGLGSVMTSGGLSGGGGSLFGARGWGGTPLPKPKPFGIPQLYGG
ncbi:hypothetical protein [Polycladidibacter hongkongensis]|uniref:hypothetical protein n=1 Tax=Polycladidibacter hongkongensis TaxID=1647556 RepID=UPI000833F852|nr:hypothetical protein [Pseudovibrio hongkongensis]